MKNTAGLSACAQHSVRSPWRSCIFAKSQTLDTKNLFDASAAGPQVKSSQVLRLRKKAAEERSEIQKLVYDGVTVHYTNCAQENKS